ncbi:MAG: hypothetical protein M1826_004844 [Phylliscum demangeonii]|nr:MAG: hypothetical protein M1826_004844 [Phylliscum demangeonii]
MIVVNSALALHLRLLLWTCSSECDYTCQHIVTDQRRAQGAQPAVVQYHGKWPFHRFLGAQEPCSVLFSLFNLLAHRRGLAQIQAAIPKDYALLRYYRWVGYIGVASWTCSMIFHTRDFSLTEKADYFAAGANVLYGLYYAVVRIFRLYHHKAGEGARPPLLQLWTVACLALYVAHVLYLTFWRWDYGYNMFANVLVGVLQNTLWTGFSIRRYRRLKQPWTAWPGLIVAWIVLAMSLELLDFSPLWGLVDAHSLWHLGTVGPTIWWYRFLVKDAQEDLEGVRVKA